MDATRFGGVEFKVFRRGDSSTDKTWWISDQSGKRVCIITLKYNTVIEAIQNVSTMTLAQDLLWSAINEIERRIQLFANTSPPVIPHGKLFNSTNLTKLNISKLTEFWQGDSLFQRNDTSQYESFLYSIAYAAIPKSSGIEKFISISVYETTDQAILRIYKQRTWSQAVTCYGDPDSLVNGGVWFYTCDTVTPYVGITFQKWNTIVDIIYSPQNYEIITNTVKEIARRIDELSK